MVTRYQRLGNKVVEAATRQGSFAAHRAARGKALQTSGKIVEHGINYNGTAVAEIIHGGIRREITGIIEGHVQPLKEGDQVLVRKDHANRWRISQFFGATRTGKTEDDIPGDGLEDDIAIAEVNRALRSGYYIDGALPSYDTRVALPTLGGAPASETGIEIQTSIWGMNIRVAVGTTDPTAVLRPGIIEVPVLEGSPSIVDRRQQHSYPILRDRGYTLLLSAEGIRNSERWVFAGTNGLSHSPYFYSQDSNIRLIAIIPTTHVEGRDATGMKGQYRTELKQIYSPDSQLYAWDILGFRHDNDSIPYIAVLVDSNPDRPTPTFASQMTFVSRDTGLTETIPVTHVTAPSGFGGLTLNYIYPPIETHASRLGPYELKRSDTGTYSYTIMDGIQEVELRWRQAF